MENKPRQRRSEGMAPGHDSEMRCFDTDDVTATDEAHLPINAIAKLSLTDEALRHANRFLRRLPKNSVSREFGWLDSPRIYVAANDKPRMEKYLAIAEATEPFNTRKCDKGFSLDSVREFRAFNGLLDPADAKDETAYEGVFPPCRTALQ